MKEGISRHYHSLDPDLYPVGTLIDYVNKKPDMKKIAKFVEDYIPKKGENLYAEQNQNLLKSFRI